MTGKLPHTKQGFVAFRQNFYNFEAGTAQRMIAELFDDTVICDERVIESLLVIRRSSRSRKDS